MDPEAVCEEPSQTKDSELVSARQIQAVKEHHEADIVSLKEELRYSGALRTGTRSATRNARNEKYLFKTSRAEGTRAIILMRIY